MNQGLVLCLLLIGLTYVLGFRSIDNISGQKVGLKLKFDDSSQQIANPRQMLIQSIQKSIILPSIVTLGGLAASITAVQAEETKKKVKKPKVLETDLGIKYIELKKGAGAFPVDGDYVVIAYNAFLFNGTLFDSSDAKGRKPISFRMGKKQVIPGLESVISYMQPGGEVTCTIPSQYAYGEKGVCVKDGECLVPPNEALKYYIKLISVGSAYN